MTRNHRGGNPNTFIYSYRGIIRISMVSEGKNAIDFRDWAEKVLYEVMTTGGYGHQDIIRNLEQQIEMLKTKIAQLEGNPHYVKEYESPIQAFISTWWRVFGNKDVVVRELHLIVQHYKIPLDISAKTEVGEKVRLAHLIKKLKNKEFKLKFDSVSFDVNICKTGTWNKSLKWQLKEKKAG